MAKEDFCFTYYDGDAARDMAHMNRLERGGYMDLIVSQRKFGRLSLDLIKKTLGSDFENIWESIRIVLRQDAESKFFVEWVEISVEKMRRQSVKQKENGKLGGRPKANNNPNGTQLQTQTLTQKKPLEDGDGNEDVLGFKKNGTAENLLHPDSPIGGMVKQFTDQNDGYFLDTEKDFAALREVSEKIHKWLKLPGRYDNPENEDCIRLRWGELIVHVKADSHFAKYSLQQINKHFSSIAQSFSNGRGQPHKPVLTTVKGTSQSRTDALKNWGASGGE